MLLLFQAGRHLDPELQKGNFDAVCMCDTYHMFAYIGLHVYMGKRHAKSIRCTCQFSVRTYTYISYCKELVMWMPMPVMQVVQEEVWSCKIQDTNMKECGAMECNDVMGCNAVSCMKKCHVLQCCINVVCWMQSDAT